MHIGVVAETDSFHTEKWTQALQEQGVQVTVFTLSAKPIADVRCVHIPPRFTRQGQLTYLSYLGSADRLRRALLAHRVDLVNPINVTPHGAWARRAGVGPIVMVSMGADILEYPPQRSQRIAAARSWESNTLAASPWQRLRYAAKWHLFRHEVAQALRASALITGDNRQLTRAVEAWFGIEPDRIYLHRWGIDERLFAPDPAAAAQVRQQFDLPPGQRVVLSPRGLKPIYQGDLVLQAFEQLLREGLPNVTLIALATGYDVPAELDWQARHLAARYPAFRYQRARMPRALVAQLWRMTDLFVNVPVYDGFSNALCEGRYVGAIPLLHDIPAHREVADPQHAVYVDPLTPDTLAAAMRHTLADYERLQPAMAAANRQWIMQHAHLPTNMRAFLDQCAKVLSRAP